MPVVLGGIANMVAKGHTTRQERRLPVQQMLVLGTLFSKTHYLP